MIIFKITDLYFCHVRKCLSYFFILSVEMFIAYGQECDSLPPVVIDTISVNERSAVLLSDHTWIYIEETPIQGILNPLISDLIEADTSKLFVPYWSNEICFLAASDLTEMQDSVWLCLTDSIHSDFCIPVPGVMTSTYKQRGSRFHHGVDLALNIGDTVRAAFSGKVRYAKYNSNGYGNLVIIRHYNGLETFYAHLSKIIVEPNQYVNAGDVIGLGGNTGRAYGPHLHFECRFFDNSINPEDIFDFDNRSLHDCNLIVCSETFQTIPRGKEVLVQMRTVQPGMNINEKGQYHRIRQGDNLWKISQMYGTTVSSVCALNKITEDTILQIGQTIKVK